MDVILDGERDFAVQGSPEDSLAVVGAVSDFLRERGRAIVTINADGEEILPQDLVTSLQGISVEQISVLEIGSGEVAALVETCLRELMAVLPELPNACRSLAEIFQGERPEEGYEPFEELANIWATIKKREAMVANALNLDLEGLEAGGQSISAIHLALNSHLEEAAQALVDEDCVLLGDLLEYELAPRAELETTIVAMLHEQAAANRG